MTVYHRYQSHSSQRSTITGRTTSASPNNVASKNRIIGYVSAIATAIHSPTGNARFAGPIGLTKPMTGGVHRDTSSFPGSGFPCSGELGYEKFALSG